MRIRGAVILAVLSALAPACGGGGGRGGGGGTFILLPLPLVDTSAPDLSIDTSQTDAAITLALKNRLAIGGIIKFTGGARTIAVTEELSLPADKTAVIDGNSVATLSG